jgi:subtilisin family serine protease
LPRGTKLAPIRRRPHPAALDHVISVAAFDEDGRKADFTSFGNWVDMSAPGNVIMSSVPPSQNAS